MTAYVALLRAVNVGGTGKLPMAELKAMGEDAGFGQVRTYIASGNLLFTSDLPEADVRAALERRLEIYAGKPVGVLVRTAAELAETLAHNPFAERPGNRVTAFATVRCTTRLMGPSASRSATRAIQCFSSRALGTLPPTHPSVANRVFRSSIRVRVARVAKELRDARSGNS